MGAFEAIARRHTVLSDGISYLEIADAYLAGRWSEAVNSYWSPLYSWLLAVARLVLVPFAMSERAALHLLNFTIFAGSLAAFHSFFRGLLSFLGIGPTRMLRLIGYTTFVWGSLGLIGVGRPQPDMLLALLCYLSSVLLLRFRADSSLRHGLALGAVLGLGYLAKAAFLPVALFFVLATGRVRRAAVAAAGLMFVMSPWLIMLSLVHGRFTVGDAGYVNYAWEVTGVRRSTHWQGEHGGSGTPKHGSRVLSPSPELYEFGSPVPGMYPPWRNPAYWYEGLKTEFDLSKQVRAVWWNGRYAVLLMLMCPALIAAVPSLIHPKRLARRIWAARFLVAPCLFGLVVYVLVFVESRYVAPFLTVLGMCVFVAGADEVRSRCGPLSATVAALISGLCFAGFRLAVDTYIIAGGTPRDPQMAIAREVARLGIGPGARLGYVGASVDAYWVRLAGARIVAEVPVIYEREPGIQRGILYGTRALTSFWRSAPETRAKVLALMKNAGADAAVADMVPVWAPTEGWIELEAKAPKVHGGDRTLLYVFGSSDSRIPPPAGTGVSTR